MDVRVTAGGEDSAGQLRTLREWLGDVAELRGRVRAVEGPPAPGTLGPVLDVLVVVLAPGGVAAAFAPALVSWVRERRGDVSVRVTCPDGGSVEMTATRVRGLDGPAVQAQVEQLMRVLRAGAGDRSDPEEPAPR